MPAASSRRRSSAPPIRRRAWCRDRSRPAPWHALAKVSSSPPSRPHRTHEPVPMEPGTNTGWPMRREVGGELSGTPRAERPRRALAVHPDPATEVGLGLDDVVGDVVDLPHARGRGKRPAPGRRPGVSGAPSPDGWTRRSSPRRPSLPGSVVPPASRSARRPARGRGAGSPNPRAAAPSAARSRCRPGGPARASRCG